MEKKNKKEERVKKRKTKQIMNRLTNTGILFCNYGPQV